MTKTWYPVIDYQICTECGSCVLKCPHDVYDKEKAPSVVKNPEFCIDHCHGCGNRCPSGAITYVGEDTGWTPENNNNKAEDDCCTCGCNEVEGKKIVVEYLYLDLQACDRCIRTDNVLDKVMTVLVPALEFAGYDVEYKKIKMETEEIAKQYEFISSPTIRVNGKDVHLSVRENNCDCCSEISGTDVDCRLFEYNGETYEVLPKKMLADLIFKAAFSNDKSGCSCYSYELPENLKHFFDGKKDIECSNCFN